MECQSLIYLSKQDMLVPCGRCAFCTATKRSDWALRLHYEAKQHDVRRFVTLTYADSKLVWKNGKSQLHKVHLQEWFREVRRPGYKVRYYAVGEYGSKTFRPHYHVLLFGDVPEEHLRKTWTHGHVHIGTVTDASVMYCLGYIVNGKGWQMKHNRVPPFSLMSLRPGLGSNYVHEYVTPKSWKAKRGVKIANPKQDMIDWHRSGRKNYAIVDGSKRHLPRYYKCKIFSKVDLVRIAVRDQKDMFRRSVAWVRSKQMQRQRDPLAYRREQLKRLAQKIRGKSKENLTI